jgi:hypothetical protein
MEAVISALVLAASSLVLLAQDRPGALPSHAVVSQWPRVAGDADFGRGLRVSYELYVEPSRPMLYAITRYRVSPGRGRADQNEMLIWNAQPGTREPVLCFERVMRPATSSAAASVEWVPVAQSSPTYRDAMMIAVRVYSAYQAVVREQAAEAERRGE